MASKYPGFQNNPEGREVEVVRTIRFERWQKPTERNPKPDAEPVGMQFQAVPDINGMTGVVGEAVIRGAVYAIGLTRHDLAALLEVAERVEDRKRAEYATRGERHADALPKVRHRRQRILVLRAAGV